MRERRDVLKLVHEQHDPLLVVLGDPLRQTDRAGKARRRSPTRGLGGPGQLDVLAKMRTQRRRHTDRQQLAQLTSALTRSTQRLGDGAAIGDDRLCKRPSQRFEVLVIPQVDLRGVDAG